MTNLIDISTTVTGKAIARDQAEIVAAIFGYVIDEHEFIRARYRENSLHGDVDYVLVRHTGSGKWNTHSVAALNHTIVKESANVPQRV